METRKLLGTHRTDTPLSIKTKLCTVNYVAIKTPTKKIGKDRLAGGFSTNGWNITLLRVPFFFTLCFSNSPTAQIKRPTYACYIPEDVV
jgi:hypothetical protein